MPVVERELESGLESGLGQTLLGAFVLRHYVLLVHRLVLPYAYYIIVK